VKNLGPPRESLFLVPRPQGEEEVSTLLLRDQLLITCLRLNSEPELSDINWLIEQIRPAMQASFVPPKAEKLLEDYLWALNLWEDLSSDVDRAFKLMYVAGHTMAPILVRLGAITAGGSPEWKMVDELTMSDSCKLVLLHGELDTKIGQHQLDMQDTFLWPLTYCLFYHHLWDMNITRDKNANPAEADLGKVAYLVKMAFQDGVFSQDEQNVALQFLRRVLLDLRKEKWARAYKLDSEDVGAEIAASFAKKVGEYKGDLLLNATEILKDGGAINLAIQRDLLDLGRGARRKLDYHNKLEYTSDLKDDLGKELIDDKVGSPESIAAIRESLAMLCEQSSDLERKVLDRVLIGQKPQEIASILGCTAKQVRDTKRRIIEKAKPLFLKK